MVCWVRHARRVAVAWNQSPDYSWSVDVKTFWLRLAPAENIPMLLTRATLGYGFHLTGSGKLAHPEAIVTYFQGLGVPLASVQAPLVARLEYWGGIALFLGLATRPIAFLVASTMVVALWLADRVRFLDIHWPAPGGKQEPWLSVLMSQIQEEVEQRRPGHHSILSKIFDIIFCQTLRKWVAANASCDQGWPGALHDPVWAGLLETIHAAPGDPWNVDSMAQKASMSRSQFSRKFCQRLGVPPMVYVTKWRLWRSYQLLRQQTLSVSAIAGATGFSCETALARAFRREFGISPSEVRKGSERGDLRTQVS